MVDSHRIHPVLREEPLELRLSDQGFGVGEGMKLPEKNPVRPSPTRFVSSFYSRRCQVVDKVSDISRLPLAWKGPDLNGVLT
jgi:hypothetical protein